MTLLIIHPPAALLVLLLTSSPLLADTVEVLELGRATAATAAASHQSGSAYRPRLADGAAPAAGGPPLTNLEAGPASLIGA